MRMGGSDSNSPLSRSNQWRLLGPILGLILVIVLIEMAANPGNWKWFADMGKDEKKQTAPRNPNPKVKPLPEPNFGVARKPLTAPRPNPDRIAGDHAKPLELQLTEKLLESIDDNKGQITAGEAKAYWVMLAIAGRPDDQQPGKVWEGVPYSDLFGRPDAYRGERIAISGKLRLLQKQKLRKNPAGLDVIYEAFIFPADETAKSKPYWVYLHHAPEGVPVGKPLETPVAVKTVGYLFKRRGYETRRGEARQTPFLLAREVTKLPQRAAAVADAGRGRRYVIYIVLGLVFAVFAVMWSVRRSRPTVGFQMPSKQPGAIQSSEEDVGKFLDNLNAEEPNFETAETKE